MMLIVPCKRQSGSNQHLAQNKKNVLPYGPNPRKINAKLTSASQSLREVNGLAKH
jgi:hypothetical protein